MISVCIAVHNGEKFLKEQLQSILSQIAKNDEIVISDDGSCDDTIRVIRDFNDSRIKLFFLKQSDNNKYSHYYVTKNFENAIKNASGDYIFLADQDDFWFPDKVNVCMRELKKYDLVIHNIRIADDKLNDLGKNVYAKEFFFKNIFMLEGSYYGCAMAFNKNVLNYALPFPKKLLVHDIWIGLLTEFLGSVHFINKPLILYRVREESISHSVHNSLLYKISYRIYTLLFLILRILRFRSIYTVEKTKKQR